MGGNEVLEGLLLFQPLKMMVRRQLSAIEDGMMPDLEAIEATLYFAIKYLEAVDAITPSLAWSPP